MNDTLKQLLESFPSERWHLNGDYFNVEVLHYQRPWSESDSHDEKIQSKYKNHWHIYVRVFEQHPFYHKVETGSIFQGGLDELEFHHGVSIVSKNSKYVLIGNDYNHEWDSEYRLSSDKEYVLDIFQGAAALFDKLKAMHATK